MKSDEYWMEKALNLAHKAAENKEVPVGAVVVCNNQIIGEGWNRREGLKCPTAHAEIIAISQAAERLQAWRLENCTLFVTLEPCSMCAGAIINSRIPKVVYGADDPKAGAVKSLYELLSDKRLNHQVDVSGGMLAEDCSEVLKTFFKKLRSKK